jgi:hypothetical protein
VHDVPRFHLASLTILTADRAAVVEKMKADRRALDDIAGAHLRHRALVLHRRRGSAPRAINVRRRPARLTKCRSSRSRQRQPSQRNRLLCQLSLRQRQVRFAVLAFPYAARNGRHSPTRTRRSGWPSPEDYGDRRNTTRKLICGFLSCPAIIPWRKRCGALIEHGGSERASRLLAFRPIPAILSRRYASMSSDR